MGNHKDNFKKRNEKGNIAEKTAIDFYGTNLYRKKTGFILKTGLDAIHGDLLGDNVPANIFRKIPRRIRNIPDFLIINVKNNFFVEVKGCCENIKFKIKDLESYKYWNKILEVIIFIYATKVDSIYRIRYTDLESLINEVDFKVGSYDDNGEKYYSIPVKELTLKGKSSQKRKY